MLVESYLPGETVHVENPLTALDFIYVVQGCLDFELDDAIAPDLSSSQMSDLKLGASSKKYRCRLAASEHIDQSDLRYEQEFI